MHFFCMYGHNYQYLIFLGAEKPAPIVLPAPQKRWPQIWQQLFMKNINLADGKF